MPDSEFDLLYAFSAFNVGGAPSNGDCQGPLSSEYFGGAPRNGDWQGLVLDSELEPPPGKRVALSALDAKQALEETPPSSGTLENLVRQEEVNMFFVGKKSETLKL